MALIQDIYEEPVQMQTQNIIIIHPGSLNVRIGRASDLLPHTELHAVARKRRLGGKQHADNILPPVVSNLKDVENEVDSCRLQVQHMIGSRLTSFGHKRYVTPPQQISAFNKRVEGVALSDSPPVWIKPEGDVAIGDEILNLDPCLDFNVHFPMKRGELNLHPEVGGSLTAVLADLRALWMFIIETRLRINPQDLKKYRVVLVIPDIYNRTHLRELITLLLVDMGFSSCFLLQDHVAATFGCGLGVACVVDVGHGKTSVSCVEDGISHPATRVRLPYGGGDITQCFHWLLKKCGFPYAADPVHMPRDAMLLERLKQDSCHVDLDLCGSRELSFRMAAPGSPTLSYTIQTGDEALIAPLSLFFPDLLALTGPKTLITQSANTGDPTDPHDREYLRETGRKKECDVEPDDGDLAEMETSGAGEFCPSEGGLLPLDQAILQSIQRCSSEDVKRKMFSSVVVVGGGVRFRGMSGWLENRLKHLNPFPTDDEEKFVVEGRDVSAAWKGAAIMACLDSAGELWISAEEWSRYGVKLIRERGPFMW